MENKQNTCCFTGHRKVAAYHYQNVEDALRFHIRDLCRCGITHFIAGGALGFDTLAALIVLEEARTDDRIRLTIAVPCLDQTKKWEAMPDGTQAIQTYEDILSRAHEVIYTSDRPYFDGCMKLRNQYMVDHAAFCIAYWNGRIGGTSQTVRLANAGGLRLFNIYQELKGQ